MLPGVGVNALTLLGETQPPPIESVLATLLNDLSAVPNDVVLVLDDYHAIDAPDIQAGMAYLLEHLPPSMHLVIATRADPALPLARMRARGELVEIRVADLRFSPDEAAAYLNDVMKLSLTAPDIAALEDRTEGWIAALQLAALSMQGRDDVAAFIAAFAGDDRYIVDYLVDEVLQRQPRGVRDFLLQTSILVRMTGRLCDAVTGQVGGNGTLEALDRGNLFLVALDDRRQWYRYHHLFGDVLRAHLLNEQLDRIPDLHRRASEWYEQNGEPFEAIRHALAGDDVERAADLIELAIPAMRRARQEATLLGWLEALPAGVVNLRPVLGVERAGMLLANGELDDVEAQLQVAEQWLESSEGARERRMAGSSEVVVRDEEGFRRLPSRVAIYRAARAMAGGDVEGVISHARRALDVMDSDDDFTRGAAAGFLALAHWRSGQLEVAHSEWTEARASLRKSGHIADAIGCDRALALIRIAQGRLREAMTTYQRGLELATEQSVPVPRGAADMHVGMSELFIEWNDLDAARRHLGTSQELGEHAGLAQNPYRWRVAMARIQEAEGDIDGALDLLHEAERSYVSEFYPEVRPIAALRARMWARHGRLGEALDWVRERELTAEDDLSYLREFEHITLARLLIEQSEQGVANHPLDPALGLLDRLLTAAEEGHRIGSVIEILVQQAHGHLRLGSIGTALRPLERALELAEPAGYVRIFVEDGARLAPLLDAAAKRGIAVDYVRRLLKAHSTADTTGSKPALAEPLSKRELDVLRLLATELDGPGIAGELFVGVSTIRSHTKSIYAKLGVNSRRAAVRRGEELGLLPRASST